MSDDVDAVLRGDARWCVLTGDCRELLTSLPDASVHAVVCDPPYELTFMGRKWDASGVAFDPETWREVLRVLKPGAHLLAFGGTRTFHRMTCAIEDAGFEVRDCIMWLYGSGFPKSLDVSKAIDGAAGADREPVRPLALPRGARNATGSLGGGWQNEPMETAPATPEAAQWSGWGTALKPAYEPVVLARKPLDGTVAANVLAHGTGGLNIKGCRIELELARNDGRSVRGNGCVGSGGSYAGGWNQDGYSPVGCDESARHNGLGRWPANVALDEEAAAALDQQSGDRVHGAGHATDGAHCGGKGPASRVAYSAGIDMGPSHRFGDSGGASRFFYCAKASRADRERGLEDMARTESHEIQGRSDPDAPGGNNPRSGVRGEARANTHPTVKPRDLMRWLVRLVTPPGGVVLDPFTGSGSTGVAAMLEGARFIGCELTDEYVPIASARIEAARNETPTDIGDPIPKPAESNERQVSLFGEVGR